jgi:chromosome segregation ATPase
MSNLVSLVSAIETKLNKLTEKQKALIAKLEKYENDIQELKKVHDEHKDEISKLKEQYRILKLSKTLETKEGAVEAKTKINELVREIDKCIGLLNT